jgi:hypothetical protein
MATTTAAATASIEIRAPRAHVRALADRPRASSRWLWTPAQVGPDAPERELPDGTYQRVNEGGDRLRDRVLGGDNQGVNLESEWLPKEKGVPPRRLHLRLELLAGAGTTRASLSVTLPDRPPVTEAAEQRKWRRHVEGCLQRLQTLAEQEAVAAAAHPVEPDEGE